MVRGEIASPPPALKATADDLAMTHWVASCRKTPKLGFETSRYTGNNSLTEGGLG